MLNCNGECNPSVFCRAVDAFSCFSASRCSRPHLPLITPLSSESTSMTEPKPNRIPATILGDDGLSATASALAGVAMPAVHAAEDNTIRVALIGCGGRGTGAAGNALSTTQGPDQAGGHGRRL